MLCTIRYRIKVKVNQYLQGQSLGDTLNIFGAWWFYFVMGVSDMELINLTYLGLILFI